MLERWLELVGRVSDSVQREIARGIFEDLVSRYVAADRGYHNLRHIEACLGLFDSVRGMAQRPDSIEIAIWFHDAIYDSHRSDNEQASAHMAMDAMGRLGVAATVARPVFDLILATRHNAPAANDDAALLIDIDLSILGQPVAVFDEYEAGVRFEYAWVTEPAFREGRAKVLQGFLDRPCIYSTEHFRGMLESAARGNLVRSLRKLRE